MYALLGSLSLTLQTKVLLLNVVSPSWAMVLP